MSAICLHAGRFADKIRINTVLAHEEAYAGIGRRLGAMDSADKV